MWQRKQQECNQITYEDLERDVTVEEYMACDDEFESDLPEIDESSIVKTPLSPKPTPPSIYDSMSDEEIHQEFVKVYGKDSFHFDERGLLKQHEKSLHPDPEQQRIIEENQTIIDKLERGERVPGWRVVSIDKFGIS